VHLDAGFGELLLDQRAERTRIEAVLDDLDRIGAFRVDQLSSADGPIEKPVRIAVLHELAERGFAVFAAMP
jgi:hypothetical protein